MITKEQADNIIGQKLLNYNEMSIEEVQRIISDHVNYLKSNYNDLDDKLKVIVDKYFEEMFKLAEQNISKMPEGLEKLKGQRLIKRSRRQNFDAEQLTKILESKNTDDNKPILIDTRDIFISTLQNIIDFLSDITEHSSRGINHFAILSLFYLIIDELLTTFHLSQHNFVNQAFTHIRTITEELDKIRLFYKEPKLAELWISEKPEDKKAIRDKLSTPAVRRQLGKDSLDPMYKLFSELGPHGAYTGIKARTTMEININEKPDRINAQFWIGGCPLEHNIICVNTFLIKVLGEVLFEVNKIYEGFLNNEEVEDSLNRFMNRTKAYNEKHFIPWARSEGFDVNPMIDMLKKEPWLY